MFSHIPRGRSHFLMENPGYRRHWRSAWALAASPGKISLQLGFFLGTADLGHLSAPFFGQEAPKKMLGKPLPKDFLTFLDIPQLQSFLMDVQRFQRQISENKEKTPGSYFRCFGAWLYLCYCNSGGIVLIIFHGFIRQHDPWLNHGSIPWFPFICLFRSSQQISLWRSKPALFVL